MKTIYSFILLIFAGVLNVTGQLEKFYYLDSDFETIEDQNAWSTETEDIISWKFQKGGENGLVNPPIAAQGELNATLFILTSTPRVAKLISDTIQLGAAQRPLLTFQHAQYDSPFGIDQLRLYFRENPSVEWTLIDSFLTSVIPWAEKTYDIKEKGAQFLSDEFQIAFQATVGHGWGICLDTIVVVELDTVFKFVKSAKFSHVNHKALPAGIQDIPVSKINLKIYGNTGDAVLNSISVTPEGTGLSFLEEANFKLFATGNKAFKPFINNISTCIATASMSGGKVTFSGLNDTLDLGENIFWVAVSVKDNITSNATVRFNFDAGSVSVNDTLLPNQSIISGYNQKIYETVFFDGFESTSGWTFQGDFEVDMPKGKKVLAYYDPDSPYSGSKCLGTDLNDDGAYQLGITSATSYYAITPEMDLTYFIRTGFFMHKNFIFGGNTLSTIEASTNLGDSWQIVWSNQIDQGNDPDWEDYLDLELDTLISKKDSVILRIGIIQNLFDQAPGFNLDNFAIIGTHLENDIGITDIISPFDDCIECNNDTVKITVRNYAENITPVEIPVFYGLWGLDSTLVYDTIVGVIPKDGSVTFSFSTLASFPNGDYYPDFIVGVNLESDQDPRNDTLTKPLLIQYMIDPPSLNDFEYNEDLWIKKENSRWECLDMGSTIITDPSSPNIWVLAPSGDYQNNLTTYIESNCYDLTQEKSHIVDLEYWSNSELNADGARLEYTVNDGAAWNAIELSPAGINWNWYTTIVSALGSNGWSGSNNWITAKTRLPVAIESSSKAKFRLYWASDANNSLPQGFALNNFKVYPAPPDVGVSSMAMPIDLCQGYYADVLSVWVTNYGYNDLKTNDTMIIGFDFESDAAVIDTFILASDLIPGDSALFSMPTTFDVGTPGLYQIKAYTLIEDDPFFYITNNDTLSKSFNIWQSPITGLADTISSRNPDTLYIEPVYDADYSYLWGDNTTAPTYNVEYPGMYYLTVTSIANGCQTYDSIYIELLFNDVSVDSIIWPQSSCELTNSETIQIQLRNSGTDSLIAGEKIKLYYEFNSNPVVTDSITLSTKLLSGATKWISFVSRTEDLSSVGDYNLKAYCFFGGDTIPENDTIEQTISVYGYPSLNLGSDTIINGVSYNISVDPSYASYLWNDSVTTGSRLIDTSGVYWLDIVDVHGCPANDTIDIWFRIRDIRPISLVNPYSACNRSATEPVILRIENHGSDTITSSDNIDVSYQFESEARVNTSITVSQLFPGQYYDYTFSQQVDVTALANFDFNVTAVITGDMRPENNALDLVVSTMANPDINLGVDENTVYKVSEMLLDAGYGENYEYLWHDGSTNRTYTVTDVTNVEVFVLDNVTGCYGGDTVTVTLDILDYLVTSIDIDADACSGDYDDVLVTILNNGNQPRANTDITLEFYLGSNYLFTEYFSNIGTWIDNATKTHVTQNNTISLNSLGTDNIRIVLTTDGDLRPENDEFNLPLNVIPSPDVDFGGTAIEVDFPYTLDAGSGHASYLWSDGSGESTLITTGDGTYSVTVTGINDCQTLRSVFVADVLAVSPVAADEWDINYYPNPANDYITIEAKFEQAGEYILELFNGQSSIFYMRSINSKYYKENLFIGDLPPGLYFIRIRNNESYHISKVIIQ